MSGVGSSWMIYGTPWCASNHPGLSTCGAVLCMSHALETALESGQEAIIERFISALPLIGSIIRDFFIGSVQNGVSVLSILAQFLSNQSQHVTMDRCQSKLVNVVHPLYVWSSTWAVCAVQVTRCRTSQYHKTFISLSVALERSYNHEKKIQNICMNSADMSEIL